MRILLIARSISQAERIRSLLEHRKMKVLLLEKLNDIKMIEHLLEFSKLQTGSMEVVVGCGTLVRGFISIPNRMVIVTENEIFGVRQHRQMERQKTKNKNVKPFFGDLSDLSLGDFVVHREHGIGKYLGLSHKCIGSNTVDLISIEYTGGDKLHLPVYRLNQIQKLQHGDTQPKMDRLGGQSFTKTKSKVFKHLIKMADDLLKMFAERKSATCEALPPVDDEYSSFEASFPFDETMDQLRAISDVNCDLDLSKPMDRLICGDVGFGKTEVALRAAFRVASQGKQVAVLCPTTILAEQHALTFMQRLRNYPFEVRALSRFQTKSEQEEIVQKIRDGKVDIIIGTHRMLSKDIHFKRLGLLVVDEEQRFGVLHKERIKSMRTNIHVLTLSATPIPRTLQMAISGIRDMSLISTPPVDRRSIRTSVMKFEEATIHDAIVRELDRKGQVFYVYNRVEGLYERAEILSRLLPKAKIGVAHGQLSETALEKVMHQFVNGNLDILCSTAIIESGLDIPRANTMIIDRADMFGLSQLYQLRGRVGRSKERAYCYLIVPPPSSMTDESRSRIEAMQKYTELGSGFHISSLDLEIRGSGDLLGREQSGNIASVGFELFCEMLDEVIHHLRGETIVHEVDPELIFDVDAFLPDDYISEVGSRLSLYKRLASALDPNEVHDLAQEMEDRFGVPPIEARQFIHLMRIKTLLRKLKVLTCEASTSTVSFYLREDAPLSGDPIAKMVQGKNAIYKISPDRKITRKSRPHESFLTSLESADQAISELMECMN